MNLPVACYWVSSGIFPLSPSPHPPQRHQPPPLPLQILHPPVPHLPNRPPLQQHPRPVIEPCLRRGLDEVPDQELQALLREFSEEEIATILKGKDEDVRVRILDNVSERMRQMVTEESDRLGAMKRRDVEKATREFVTYIRELADEGKILLTRTKEALSD